ncbi:far upstream element-binding protein 2 [Helianthus annuus]|uniref:Putative KH domain-containing protein n=1 Tax=Helianthus annuus TaxID=4232 RepID=A0A251SVE0_HELAN|nr:far upstream element-binding protein 2 [Helianthus annuus]
MADDSHYPSSGDSASVKRKYEDVGPPPSSARRPTGFSAPDSAPSYNNVPPPMDEIQLAKQKAQEIAARIFNNAEAKRSKFDNDGTAGGGGWDASDARDFSSGPTDMGHAAASIPSSYGGYAANSSKKIEIPNGKVGVIIGKAGETIKYLQMQSGAKIQITRDMDADPHSQTRDVEITGTADSIAKAEQLIKDVLAEAESGGSGTVSRRVSGQSGGGEQFVMKIPNKKVGLVIGKGGETIKSMQATTGARIQVIPLHLPPGDTSTERTVQIDGTSDQIEAAKQMVNEVISENRARNPMGGGYSQQGYQAQPPTSWAPPGQQMQQQGGYGYYGQPGAYPGQAAYTQQPYGGGYAAGWDQSSAQQTAQGGGGGGYDYYGQQQSQQTQPPGGPGSTDTSAYGYGQQGQGYGQDGYYQHGYGNPSSGYNTAGQTDGQTAGYGAQGDNASQAPPTSAPQSGYGQQPSSNPSYPPQGSGQPGYGSQPSGYGGYGPPPTQKPPVSQPTNGQSPSATGYAQPAYGAPPTYGATGYGQPPYGAPPAGQPSYGGQQPPAYGGGYQQPPAYSSDAAASQAAPPVPKASPQQN